MPEAPAIDQALTRLPRHLALGLRVMKKEVCFGLQLREAGLLAAARRSRSSARTWPSGAARCWR